MLVLALLWALSVHGQPLSQSTALEAATGSHGMAATAHPLASRAALEILQQGGNAIDAAVAAAFVIGVVEPDGSGLGGGGGMVVYLAKKKKALYINYYPSAPSGIKAIPYAGGDDARSARAVLVPGTVAGLTRALEEYGTLPLAKVIAPAIRYAEEGFPIDETLSTIMLDNVALIQQHAATEEIYFRDGFPRMEGDTIRQPALARTLRLIAERGRPGFYEGEVARSIADEVTQLGGAMTLEDLRSFEAETVDPLRGSYRGIEILTAPPPHSGVFVLEALNMLECDDLRSFGHYSASADALHLMAETLRRVYADRSSFLADPKFEEVPLTALMSKAYALERRNDINLASAEPREYRKTKPGNPAPYIRGGRRHGDAPPLPDTTRRRIDTLQRRPSTLPALPRKSSQPANDISGEGGGHTTHLCVVDSAGNAVSLTQTLGTFFGSGVTAAGVLLNNARSNFSVTTSRNAAGPGKRPRSSISPTILLKDGRVFLVVGSPGATRIIATVFQIIVNVVDYELSALEANRAPRFLCMKLDDYLHLESRIDPAVRAELERRGHSLRLYGDFDLFFGGAQIIMADPLTGTLTGSADPRRGGVAAGF
jgi:gamma-glutamyltranspeptidase/glutathione hydrolase